MKKLSIAEENAMMERAKQQRAVDELAAMLCGDADPAPDTEPARVIKVDSETGTMQPLEAETTTTDHLTAEGIKVDMIKAAAEMCIDEDTEAIQIDVGPGFLNECEFGKYQMTRANDSGIRIAPIQNDPECHSLRLYNEAISALDALINDGIDDETATEQAESLLDRLRQVRMNAFEHMVPWEQLAGGGAQWPTGKNTCWKWCRIACCTTISAMAAPTNPTDTKAAVPCMRNSLQRYAAAGERRKMNMEKKPDSSPIIIPNGREIHIIEFLVGLHAQVKQGEEILKDRIQKIPGAWRDYRLTSSKLEKVLGGVYATLPTKTLRHMDRLCQCGEVIIRPKPMIKMPDDVQIVPTEDLRMLINFAMTSECAICLKDCREQKKCRLRNALSTIAPANNISVDGLCPYANVVAKCEYGQYI